MLSLFNVYHRGDLVGEVEASDELHARIEFLERHRRVLLSLDANIMDLAVEQADDWLRETADRLGT